METQLTLHDISTMLTGAQIWRHRIKGAELTEGCYAIHRVSYQEDVWDSHYGEYIYKIFHRYYVGTYHDGKVMTSKGVPFVDQFDWFPFEVTQAQYDRVKRSKEKVAQEEAEKIAREEEERLKRLVEERAEQKRKEEEEAAKRAEYEKRAAIERAEEEKRRAKAISITVGQLEDLISSIEDLKERVHYLEENVEYRYRSEEE